MRWIFLILFFLGCSTKTTPIYTLIKTPNLKVSDQGFLKEGFGYKEIEIYKAGMAPFKILIKNSLLCINNNCYDKGRFLKSLSPDYPPDLLDKILNRQPLLFFDKIIKVKGGFLQKNERFYYLATKKKVLFKDKKRKIAILIKNLKD